MQPGWRPGPPGRGVGAHRQRRPHARCVRPRFGKRRARAAGVRPRVMRSRVGANGTSCGSVEHRGGACGGAAGRRELLRDLQESKTYSGMDEVICKLAYCRLFLHFARGRVPATIMNPRDRAGTAPAPPPTAKVSLLAGRSRFHRPPRGVHGGHETKETGDASSTSTSAPPNPLRLPCTAVNVLRVAPRSKPFDSPDAASALNDATCAACSAPTAAE